MAFHETRFPDDISEGSSGGPERRTDVITLRSGFEQRNAVWANSRRRYDASLGIRDINDIYQVIEFFEARRGQLHGFRWKDWTDYKSGSPRSAVDFTDQIIGTGNGVATQFQLTKTYSPGVDQWVREIKKPVAGTVRVGVNSIEQTIVAQFDVNTTTGIITFVSPPTNGHVITAGFQFDVPVRFGSDSLSLSVDAFEAGSLPQIEIMEIRV